MAVPDDWEAFGDARSRPAACPGLCFRRANLLTVADNTWNAYACDINETVVLENARFMNKSGLLQAGYEYVVIDGKCLLVHRLLVLMGSKTVGCPITDRNQETLFLIHFVSHQE